MEVNVLALVLPVEIFVFLASLLIIQSAGALRGGDRFLRYVRRSHREPPGDFTPRAAVIIPCKGVDPDFQRNITRLLRQNYPLYQLIFVVAEAKDPAHGALTSLFEGAGGTGAPRFAPDTALLVA